MSKTFAIFGTTQMGKSTLAGYLSSRHLSNHDFNREMQQYRMRAADMGINIATFQKCAWISCFTSMDYDELTRPNNGQSTTKRLHNVVSAIPIDGQSNNIIRVIDTIGISINSLEDYKGVFESDYGLILITYDEVEKYITYRNTDSFEKLLLPLSFWCAFKPKTQVAIVISRTSPFERQDIVYFNKINDMIKELKKYIYDVMKIDIPIVPISIMTSYDGNTFYRESYNIERSVDGIQTKCLLDIIRLFLSNSEKNYNMQQHATLGTFASTIRIFHNAKGEHKPYPSLRVKVINGSINLDDRVIIAPVLYNDEIVVSRGTVSSLKNDETHDKCDVLPMGWIGGVRFRDLEIVNSRDRLKDGLNDIKLLNTTILCHDLNGENYSLNNCIRIRISSKDSKIKRLLSAMLPKENVKLFYYGKPITLSVIEKIMVESDEYLLTLARFNIELNNMFFLPSKTPIDSIKMPIAIRDGIVSDGDKHNYSYDSCVIEEATSITDESNYKMVVNLPHNTLVNEINILNWNSEKIHGEDGTRIIINNINKDDLGEQLKNIREFLSEWYVGECNFHISLQ